MHNIILYKKLGILNEKSYPLVIWEDFENEQMSYRADGEGLYHIRAFYYCKKYIYESQRLTIIQ
jgi:hypothetical protein